LILYLFASILPVLGSVYNKPDLILIGIWTILFLIVFYIALDVLRNKTLIVNAKTKKFWLELHYLFRVSEISVLLMIYFSILYSLMSIESEWKPYVLLWATLTTLLVFPFFNYVKNVFGMKFEVIESGSIIGASAFATLALEFLNSRKRNEKRKGLDYLMIAIRMLNQSLAHEERDLQHLREVEAMLETLRKFGSEIPYELLKNLCKSLSKLPELSEVPDELEKFTQAKEVQWTRKLKKIKREKRKTLETISIITGIAFGSLTVLSQIIPESWKPLIMDYVAKTNWISLITIILFSIWIYAIFSFITRLSKTRVKLKDINKLPD